MLRAIIFDFNGVILDDEEYHYEAFNKVLSEEGMPIAREDYYRNCLGFGDDECFLWAFKSASRTIGDGVLEKLVSRKSVFYQELLKQKTCFFPGVLEFISRAAEHFLLAVASMALVAEIEYALRKGHVRRYFKVVTGAEHVERSKPDPEVYIKTLARLDSHVRAKGDPPLLPAECVVIEDSVQGVQAAKAAGIKCLAISNTVDPELLCDADWILPTLKGLLPRTLESMFSGR